MPNNTGTSPIMMFGAYIVNASTSIGWGGQGGSMQFTLIEDPENNVILNMPKVGTPVYFKYGTMFMAGFLQRYTYSESVGSGRKYDVVIESPTKFMDGVQLILEDFMGTTDLFVNSGNQFNFSTNISSNNVVYGNIENVYNLFGYYENPFYGGFFGNSNFNSSGLEVDRALIALQDLARNDHPQDHPLSGAINIAGFKYALNVQEMLDRVQDIWSFYQDSYRVKGPVQSVNGLMGEIAEAIQVDYYYDLRTIRPARLARLPEGGHIFWGNSIASDDIAAHGFDFDWNPPAGIRSTFPIIKVMTVDKSRQPTPGALTDWVKAAKTATPPKVVSYSIGEELTDATTQRMVYGGRRTRYQVAGVERAFPVWGVLPTSLGAPSVSKFKTFGTTMQIHGNGGNYGTGMGANPSGMIRLNLKGDFEGFQYMASLFEIRMALGGKQVWEIYKTFETMAGVEPNRNILGYNTNNLFTCPWTGAFTGTKDILNLLARGRGSVYDAAMTHFRPARKQFVKAIGQLNDAIFSSVSEVANNFYCQEFMVPLVSELTTLRQSVYNPPGDFEQIKAWEIADSAFVNFPLADDIAMRDGEGKQKSMVAYPKNSWSDYSGLGSDYANGRSGPSTQFQVGGGFGGLIVSSKGSPDKEQYYSGGTWFANFKAGGVVKAYDFITTPDFGLSVMAAYFFGISIRPEFYLTPGFNGVLQFQIPPDNLIPHKFGIPQQSNRYNYGPWITLVGRYSPEGKAEVQGDESMRPETYGGYGALQNMGNIVATAGAGEVAPTEAGMIEAVGKPEGAIGERFAASGPYLTNMDVSIDATGGVKTTYKFNTWTPNFGKLAKYNVDRIAKINKASWNFAQKNRSKVEKRPFPKFKFEKMDFAQEKKKLAPDVGAINHGLKPGAQANDRGLGNPGGGGRNNPNNANFGGFNN
tara:strand:+ start:36062 stop:38824 length:2763 start_codon:yes stop_codon:yes gene_type:complete